MEMKGLFPPVLLGPGKALLLASSSIALGLSLRRNDSLDATFVKISVGFFALFFFSSFADGSLHLSTLLTKTFEDLLKSQDLKSLIATALEEAARAPHSASKGLSSSANIPAVIEQVWRTGVWGVISTIAECFFLLSSFLLEIARDVTWQLILLLYPLACGIYPLFPQVLHNLAFHTLSVSLWWPIFALITSVTSAIARNYMAHTDSWGLAILAVECIAIFMTFSVPFITHKLLSGTIDGKFTDISVSKVIRTVARGAS